MFRQKKSRMLRGEEVKTHIERFYKKKGYSAEHAEEIAGGVAHEEHKGLKIGKPASRSRKRREFRENLVHKHAKYVKGSPEAKAEMARLRELRNKKKVEVETSSVSPAGPESAEIKPEHHEAARKEVKGIWEEDLDVEQTQEMLNKMPTHKRWTHKDFEKISAAYPESDSSIRKAEARYNAVIEWHRRRARGDTKSHRLKVKK